MGSPKLDLVELRAELAQLKERFEFVEKTGRMIAQAADRMRDHEKTQDAMIRRLRANLDEQIACKIALSEDLVAANDRIAALVAERDRMRPVVAAMEARADRAERTLQQIVDKGDEYSSSVAKYVLSTGVEPMKVFDVTVGAWVDVVPDSFKPEGKG